MPFCQTEQGILGETMPLIRDLLALGRDDSHPSWRSLNKAAEERGEGRGEEEDGGEGAGATLPKHD